jgi:hypothetical protein
VVLSGRLRFWWTDRPGIGGRLLVKAATSTMPTLPDQGPLPLVRCVVGPPGPNGTREERPTYGNRPDSCPACTGHPRSLVTVRDTTLGAKRRHATYDGRMATNPKDPKLAGISASSPECRATMDRLIASLKPVKISLSLRPSR